MKKIALVALTAAMGAAVGCQNAGQKQALSDVPPPPAMQSEPEAVAFEPVVVEPAQPIPAYSEPTPVAPEPAVNTYTIQKGDTLWSIATRHYGNGHRWQDIVAANPGLNPSKLPVGKAITLP